ncbi:28S ribosomal protein S11, mitochondrial isoform X1 [Cervus elaphus]|uniref:28S ribosomal protein S11, mitochondrial isoform X1 n=1 Tax=Cervus elaphus TaxID=9860 RepID=UPI001CC2E9D1|nr:28S ribosomal protein S11, mitochondrial isoform X1 [Cervus elaphus]
MQVVRNAGSWLLRSWAWPPTTRIVAGVPGPTIHMSAQQMQDAAAKQEVEKAETPAPAPSRSSFSIYPPVPGQESSLRWAGKKFEEIPIAHIKASYNKRPKKLWEGNGGRSQAHSRWPQPGAGSSRSPCNHPPLPLLHTDPGGLSRSPAPCPRLLWHRGVSECQEGHGHRSTDRRHSCRSESYGERRDPRPSCGQGPGARTLVCHQGPDHGGPGSDLNHRQHPHPTQRLPPQEGTEAVRARNPAPAPNIKSCLQLGLVGSALSKLSRQGLLKPLDSKEELHFLTRWPLLVPLTGEQCGQN